MCINDGGESMEADAVAVESLSMSADGGKSFDVDQQLLWTHFYRGGVVGGRELWTSIG
jgi:hypothetical protein